MEVTESLQAGLAREHRLVLETARVWLRLEPNLGPERRYDRAELGQVGNSLLNVDLPALQMVQQPIADFPLHHIGSRRLLSDAPEVPLMLCKRHLPASTWGSATTAQANPLQMALMALRKALHSNKAMPAQFIANIHQERAWGRM